MDMSIIIYGVYECYRLSDGLQSNNILDLINSKHCFTYTFFEVVYSRDL